MEAVRFIHITDLCTAFMMAVTKKEMCPVCWLMGMEFIVEKIFL